MLRRRINSKVTVNKHKIGEKSFTRNTKMNFTNITFFIMNMVSKTMQREINNFIKNVKDSSIKYTQSAMSKARLKISPELFRELNEGLINDIYEDKEDIKLYMGFRIFGIDGTRFELPNMIIPKDKNN